MPAVFNSAIDSMEVSANPFIRVGDLITVRDYDNAEASLLAEQNEVHATLAAWKEAPVPPAPSIFSRTQSRKKELALMIRVVQDRRKAARARDAHVKLDAELSRKAEHDAAMLAWLCSIGLLNVNLINRFYEQAPHLKLN
jgi:hypothetical protein